MTGGYDGPNLGGVVRESPAPILVPIPRHEAAKDCCELRHALAESLKRGRGPYGPLLQFRQEPRNDKEMGKAILIATVLMLVAGDNGSGPVAPPIKPPALTSRRRPSISVWPLSGRAFWRRQFLSNVS